MGCGHTAYILQERLGTTALMQQKLNIVLTENRSVTILETWPVMVTREKSLVTILKYQNFADEKKTAPSFVMLFSNNFLVFLSPKINQLLAIMIKNNNNNVLHYVKHDEIYYLLKVWAA